MNILSVVGSGMRTATYDNDELNRKKIQHILSA